MNFTLLSSIFTVFSMLVFLGILLWAYSSHNRGRFESIGKTLLEEGDEFSNVNGNGNTSGISTGTGK